MDRLNLKYPVIVEGKYDKITLSAVISSAIIVLNGFAVFKSEEKKALIKKLCSGGAILLTDSDKAGAFIRARLKGCLNGITLYNVYAPQVAGKEKRKQKPSAEGLLGVEGTDAKTLYDLLLPYSSESADVSAAAHYSKADLYEMGLSGGKDSEKKRNAAAEKLGLPKGMTANAFLEAVNLLGAEL